MRQYINKSGTFKGTYALLGWHDINSDYIRLYEITSNDVVRMHKNIFNTFWKEVDSTPTSLSFWNYACMHHKTNKEI